jgi:hypothetical protein
MNPLPVPNAPSRRDWIAPSILIACVMVAMVAMMRYQGRVWFSTTGAIKLWHSDVWSSECSQQWTDPYSITHMSHGLIFAGLFWWLAKLGGRFGITWLGRTHWQLAGAVTIAAGWEVLENSSFVIERYRTATMSFEYLGDSIFNAVGDVFSCAVGFFVARRIGLAWTIALLVATELLLLLLIRDNLTLNVIMLIKPIDAIKQWQSAGH